MVENNTKEWGEYVYKKELGILLFRSRYGGTGIYGVPGYLFLRCDKGEADPAAAYHVSAGSGDLRDQCSLFCQIPQGENEIHQV